MAAITHPGSSPLTRGKREILLCEVLAGRLIPAHAGKTSSGSRPPAPPRAHPRSRGENPPFASWNALMAGSSPLTRGKQNRASISMPASGLIPAHAGKTRPFRPMRPAVWAHPRSRGENLIPGCLIAPGAGSSPLTRGKLRSGVGSSGAQGLIPAHAGKTSFDGDQGGLRGAHPRSRGENKQARATAMAQEGSSPLTRGKLRARERREMERRLIPAHAGKTPRATSRTR